MIPTGYEPQRRMVGDNGIWTCRARRADKKLGRLRRMDKWTNKKTAKRKHAEDAVEKCDVHEMVEKRYNAEKSDRRSRRSQERSTAEAVLRTRRAQKIERQHDGFKTKSDWIAGAAKSPDNFLGFPKVVEADRSCPLGTMAGRPHHHPHQPHTGVVGGIFSTEMSQ